MQEVDTRKNGLKVIQIGRSSRSRSFAIPARRTTDLWSVRKKTLGGAGTHAGHTGHTVLYVDHRSTVIRNSVLGGLECVRARCVGKQQQELSTLPPHARPRKLTNST